MLPNRSYLSYLLRLWRSGDDASTWRASLEDPHSGTRIGFSDLDRLFAYLLEQSEAQPTDYDRLSDQPLDANR